jgi:Na+-translocating membrane potential-generating system (MpsC)
MRTLGEIEAAICDGITRFEREYMGRGPKDIHAHLIGDLLVVRLWDVLPGRACGGSWRGNRPGGRPPAAGPGEPGRRALTGAKRPNDDVPWEDRVMRLLEPFGVKTAKQPR